MLKGSKPRDPMGVFGKAGCCCAVFVVSVSVLLGCFHLGALRSLGVYQLQGRFGDKFNNHQWLGLSPVIYGNTPWAYEYSMLPDLGGKVALVTGANSGVGYWTALHLARKGAHVVLTCRSSKKCSAAANEIKSNYSAASLETSIFDLASLAEVRKAGTTFLESHTRLDILVCNAGLTVYKDQQTVDGIAAVFAINHVAHQLFYKILEPLLLATAEKTADVRVVVISSSTHYNSYNDGVALTRKALNDRHAAIHDENIPYSDKKSYPESKLANVLFAQEVAERTRESPVFANSAHPGAVQTEIWDKTAATGSEIDGYKTVMQGYWPKFVNYFKGSMWSPEEGALTQVFLAAADEIREKNIRGRYFHPQALEVIPCRRFAQNRTLQKAVWAFTDALIDGKDHA